MGLDLSKIAAAHAQGDGDACAAEVARSRISNYENAVKDCHDNVAMRENFKRQFLYDFEESNASYEASAAQYRERAGFALEDDYAHDLIHRLENHEANYMRHICSRIIFNEDDWDALHRILTLENAIHCSDCYLKSVDDHNRIHYTYEENFEPSPEVELRERVLLALNNFVISGVNLAGEMQQELIRRDFLFVYARLTGLINGCIVDDGLAEAEADRVLERLDSGITYLWGEAQFRFGDINVNRALGLHPGYSAAAADPDLIAKVNAAAKTPPDEVPLGAYAATFVDKLVVSSHTLHLKGQEPLVLGVGTDSAVWTVLTKLVSSAEPEGWVSNDELPKNWQQSFKKEDPFLRKVHNKRVRDPKSAINILRCHIEARLDPSERGESAFRLLPTPDKQKLIELKTAHKTALEAAKKASN